MSTARQDQNRKRRPKAPPSGGNNTAPGSNSPPKSVWIVAEHAHLKDDDTDRRFSQVIGVFYDENLAYAFMEECVHENPPLSKQGDPEYESDRKIKDVIDPFDRKHGTGYQYINELEEIYTLWAEEMLVFSQATIDRQKQDRLAGKMKTHKESVEQAEHAEM